MFSLEDFLHISVIKEENTNLFAPLQDKGTHTHTNSHKHTDTDPHLAPAV